MYTHLRTLCLFKKTFKLAKFKKSLQFHHSKRNFRHFHHTCWREIRTPQTGRLVQSRSALPYGQTLDIETVVWGPLLEGVKDLWNERM